ncbi:hypothetical protein HKX48_006210 [Thoreauomyces humboldtii]|nr:hypothetical protein HKX48_006210 [Thoreauomyces humboldtii]
MRGFLQEQLEQRQDDDAKKKQKEGDGTDHPAGDAASTTVKDGTSATPPNTTPRGRNSRHQRDRWDEVCFLMLKQTKEGRRQNLEPKAELVCIRRVSDDSMSTTISSIDGGSIQSVNRNRNLLQLITSDDYAAAVMHVDGMMDEVRDDELPGGDENGGDGGASGKGPPAGPPSHHVGFPANIKIDHPHPPPSSTSKSIIETKPPETMSEYITRLSKPHKAFLTKYASGITDGTHAAVLGKFGSAVVTGDPLRLGVVYAKKWREWITGSGGE